MSIHERLAEISGRVNDVKHSPGQQSTKQRVANARNTAGWSFYGKGGALKKEIVNSLKASAKSMAEGFGGFPDGDVVSIYVVALLLGKSKDAIRRMAGRGAFPKSTCVKDVGCGVTVQYWRVGDVRVYLERMMT